MSKNKAPLIPPSGKAPQPKAKPPEDSAELLVMQIGDHQRAIGDLTTRLYNQVAMRENYIRSLPKSEAE